MKVEMSKIQRSSGQLVISNEKVNDKVHKSCGTATEPALETNEFLLDLLLCTNTEIEPFGALIETEIYNQSNASCLS